MKTGAFTNRLAMIAFLLPVALPPAAALAMPNNPILLAHRDERLEDAVEAAEPSARSRFQASQIYAQVGHKFVVLGHGDEGRDLINRAEALAETIDVPLLRDEALAHLANEIASTDRFERALAVHAHIEDIEIRTKLGWKLVNKLGKASDIAAARSMLARMIDEVLPIEDDLELRAELLAGTGANHRFTEPSEGVPFVYEAYGIAQALSDPYERGLFFNEIGANLMDVGHTERARRVFERSRDLINKIGNPLNRARFLAMLGGEQAEKGDRDAAASDLELGVEAALRVPAGEDRNDVLSEIARNFGQSYRFERGIEVADAIADPYHRAEGYIRIAKNMHRQKRGEDALALLDRTEALTGEIVDPYRRGIVLRKLASEWISLDMRDRAVAALRAALAAARRLDG
ncbi:MAG: hypothetical protein WD767_03485 [Alphaproteobacteria bacterium]